MALRTLAPDVETRFSLEDVFVDGEADKLAWVNGWRELPHIKPEVQRQFDYPQQFAEEIFARIERALRRSASSVVASEADAAEVDASEADPSEADPSGVNASVADPSPGEVEGAARIGRLFVLGEGDLEGESKTPSLANLPELPARYVRSSDRQIVAAQKAEYCDQAKLLLDRQEGMFLVSYETAGGWAAITKDVLTEVVGAGRDAKIVGLPSAAAEALALLCPGLIAP
jgi:hypothetical protein